MHGLKFGEDAQKSIEKREENEQSRDNQSKS
jgi:hypothetical protein